MYCGDGKCHKILSVKFFEDSKIKSSLQVVSNFSILVPNGWYLLKKIFLQLVSRPKKKVFTHKPKALFNKSVAIDRLIKHSCFKSVLSTKMQ